MIIRLTMLITAFLCAATVRGDMPDTEYTIHGFTGQTLVEMTQRRYGHEWTVNSHEVPTDMFLAPRRLIEYVQTYPDDKVTATTARDMALEWGNIDYQNLRYRTQLEIGNRNIVHLIFAQTGWALHFLWTTGDLQDTMQLSDAIRVLGRPRLNADGTVIWMLDTPLKVPLYISGAISGTQVSLTRSRH